MVCIQWLMELFKRRNGHQTRCKVKLNSFAGLEDEKCIQAFIYMQIKTFTTILCTLGSQDMRTISKKVTEINMYTLRTLETRRLKSIG